MIFQLLAFVILLGYSFLILVVSVGWWRLSEYKNSGLSQYIKVSVIVAVRNEAGNLGSLLQSLFKQNYPHLEIIIVDDHSTDGTRQLLKEIRESKHDGQTLKIIFLSEEEGNGKKAALSQGIRSATGELIVITDADCSAEITWIETIVSFYTEFKPQMILGPVRMTDGGSFFGKLQSLEFMSLISSAAGSCSAGFPLMANGANIAFTRQAFETCGGFLGNFQFPSGDDMFLMMSIKKNFGAKSIRFLKSADAIVSTPATKGIIPFIQQRKRWVSKSRGYTDPVLIAVSILVFLVNTSLVAMAVSAIFVPGFITYFVLFYLLKMIVDLPLMLGYSRFQRSVILVWLFPFMELLNAVYTLFIGIAGNFGTYKWKERKSPIRPNQSSL
jgi:cellulose synthase/poly-beta-1,6-N-acetylglucosamine synthase-like glycosyltransferase